MDSNLFNFEGLPDEEKLQKLANEYFLSLPGQPYASGVPPFNDGNLFISPFEQRSSIKEKTNAAADVKDFPGSRNLPHSVAGSGISPSALHHEKTFNIADPQTSLPDPHFSDGKIPSSVAGSGISPSAEKYPHTFNIKDPQTNLPDPHFLSDGKIPKSVAGSGISPSFIKHSEVQQGYSSYIEQAGNPQQQPVSGHHRFEGFSNSPNSISYVPYIPELPFEKELNDVLNAQIQTSPSTQLAGSNTAFNELSFYFLSGKNYFPFSKDTHKVSHQGYSKDSQLPALPKIPFDVNLIRRDFPILNEYVNGRRIIWLDNAATTQKPKQVIDRLSYYYEHENSNIHRAAHELAARATDAYELARKKVQQFLKASSPNEIIFVRGATEAINLVAKSWGEQNLNEGDEIIISHLEHHANIVPWQQLTAKKGTKLKVIPVDDDGQILLDEYAKLLGPKTKLVSITQVSNALGTVTPVKKIVEMAHQAGAKVLVDGAQTVSHMRADVNYLDCDWYVFSGHKVFGPTGIGVLYGKEELLNETQPWQGGGNMILDVTFEKTTYQNTPGRFEAGTGNIADAVGLGAAIDYVNRIGIDLISQYEHYLLLYATRLLKDVPGLRLIGTAKEKAGVISFILDGYKTEEVGAALNQYGVAVRSGHHCAQPILRRFGVEATVRPSLALYNTCADIDALVAVVQRLSSSRDNRARK
ncbi:MAG: cysteine desulfurase [Bacteroidetes bacterium]|nr:MAG: cysteine desulfurase [Bacteroidota bacterium]